MRLQTIRRLSGLLLATAMMCAAPASAADLVIHDVTVIDGTGAAPQPGMDIAVRDGRIAAIVRGRIPGYERAEHVDGRGRFLIPGLIDVHVHLKGGGAWGERADRALALRNLAGFLAHGVTTIFDAGNVPDFIYELRRDERMGAIHAPRIFATGAIFSYPAAWGRRDPGTAPPSWEETKNLLDKALARGPDLQKFSFERFGTAAGEIQPAVPPELYKRMIGYVRERGVRTTIHITNEAIARDAVEAGISTLAHPVTVAPASAKFTALLAERKIPVATTLSLFDDVKGMGWPAWSAALMPVAQANVRTLVAAGGIVAMGTDHYEGAQAARELALIVAAGVSPAAALRIATLNGAVFLGQARELGSLAPGKRADMVLLNANPLEDIANVGAIVLVYKAGVAASPATP
jgi:imidazolonepropionase-like amidohydrolase